MGTVVTLGVVGLTFIILSAVYQPSAFGADWWLIWYASMITGVLVGIAFDVFHWRVRFKKRDHRKVILVDMDGVLADWDARWDDALDELGAESQGILRSHERTEFNLFNGLNDAQRALVTKIVESPGFYSDLQMIDGAKVALRQMLRAGFDVRIVTSPWVSNPTCASDKMNWVIRNLGHEWAMRLVITTDKTIVRGDYLIDDKPVIKGSIDPSWEHIWFHQPINAKLTGKRRITDWTKWREVIAA